MTGCSQVSLQCNQVAGPIKIQVIHVSIRIRLPGGDVLRLDAQQVGLRKGCRENQPPHRLWSLTMFICIRASTLVWAAPQQRITDYTSITEFTFVRVGSYQTTAPLFELLLYRDRDKTSYFQVLPICLKLSMFHHLNSRNNCERVESAILWQSWTKMLL